LKFIPLRREAIFLPAGREGCFCPVPELALLVRYGAGVLPDNSPIVGIGKKF